MFPSHDLFDCLLKTQIEVMVRILITIIVEIMIIVYLANTILSRWSHCDTNTGMVAIPHRSTFSTSSIQDHITTRVYRNELGQIIHFTIDHHPAVISLIMFYYFTPAEQTFHSLTLQVQSHISSLMLLLLLLLLLLLSIVWLINMLFFH